MKNRRTLKRFFFLFVIPSLLIGMWMFNTVTAQANRTCVCHVEDKNTGDGHVIEVDDDSLKGHVKHGDVQCTVNCDDIIGDACNVANGGDCTATSTP